MEITTVLVVLYVIKNHVHFSGKKRCLIRLKAKVYTLALSRIRQRLFPLKLLR